MAALHRKYGIPGGASQGIDGALDVRGRLLGPRSQPAHLVGDHGKTAAGLAGTGSLDGGIEGKQVGLFGDALNDLEYAVNFIAMLFQLMNHHAGLLYLVGEAINVLAGLLDQLVAAVGFLVGQVRGAGGELSVARHFLHTAGHLGYCAGYLGSFPLLAEGRAIVVVHCRHELFGLLAQLAGRIGNASDYCPGLGFEHLQSEIDLAKLVAAATVEYLAQRVVGDIPGFSGKGVEGAQAEAQQAAEQQAR
ncbi:hypothetical protein D3C79_448910 [compost metagenome]